MISTTTSPKVPVDQPSTAQSPADAGTDLTTTIDELPVESLEFGVGQFFPHLDAPTDG